MIDTYILKLGGSVITEKKSGRPLVTPRVKAIAREIMLFRSKKKSARLIILYGGGSFGHPLAHRYQLVDQKLSPDTLVSVGYTISAMRELGTRLATTLLDAGIPVVPLQTSSFTDVRQGTLHFSNLSTIHTILESGGIPLFGGDVVFSDHTRTTIVSADRLVVELARRLKKTQLFFATDTDGVYATFPPQKSEHPLATLDRTALRKLLKAQQSGNAGTDVTGAMLGKLRALLHAHDTTAMIFNGNSSGSLVGALGGERLGTRIVL